MSQAGSQVMPQAPMLAEENSPLAVTRSVLRALLKVKNDIQQGQDHLGAMRLQAACAGGTVVSGCSVAAGGIPALLCALVMLTCGTACAREGEDGDEEVASRATDLSELGRYIEQMAAHVTTLASPMAAHAPPPRTSEMLELVVNAHACAQRSRENEVQRRLAEGMCTPSPPIDDNMPLQMLTSEYRSIWERLSAQTQGPEVVVVNPMVI